MEIDLGHVEASSRRFHKTTVLLAEKSSGVKKSDLKFHPIIVSTKERLWAITSGSGDSDFYTPYIVNASLSIEILLKWILFLEKDTWITGHNLIRLYEQISPKTKKSANEEFKKLVKANKNYQDVERMLKKEEGISIKWTLPSVIEKAAKSFEIWRYTFEKNDKSSFLCYEEMYQSLYLVKDIVLRTP